MEELMVVSRGPVRLDLADPASGRYECAGCRLSGQRLAVVYGPAAALEHLRQHVDFGHKVEAGEVARLEGELR